MDSTAAKRTLAIAGSLQETETTYITLDDGKTYNLEYLVVPEESGSENKTPIFIFPGGGTDLLPCFEPAIYYGRKTIVISPFGYGKSDELPWDVFKDKPLHGASAALQLLEKLRGVGEVILFGHSNAASNILEMASLASRNKSKVKIKEVILVNPLSLRRSFQVWVALAFSISGLLTRVSSLFQESPVDILKNFYHAPKRSFDLQKLLWEVRRSSQALIPEILRQDAQYLPRITIFQSRWDWAQIHWPWEKSNLEIFTEWLGFDSFRFVKIPGLHNVTLGKDSAMLGREISKLFL